MKKLILILIITISAKFVRAQDSLVLSDTRTLGQLISENFKLDRNVVKNYDSELFYVLIKTKDSLFSEMEILSKQNAGNKKALEEKLPGILKGFKAISGKDITIIFPILIINPLRQKPEYDFVQKLQNYSNGSSIYSSGIIMFIFPDRHPINKKEAFLITSNY